jgi:aldose sugar dehydrogenase
MKSAKIKKYGIVGDFLNGNLYYLKLNEDRNEIIVTNTTGLSDRVVDNDEELSAITFGIGFGGITDIETGPYGLLYVLSYMDGTMHRIGPSEGRLTKFQLTEESYWKTVFHI